MTVNLHGISRESFDLIVDEEVSGQATYEKKYVHPEKPGGQSGVTVGIGYDCGYSSAVTIRKDWGGKIPETMVDALAKCAGIKGDAALEPCRRIRGLVSVPWEAAIDVFSNVSIPKYMAATRKGLPGYDDLSPDCKGALLSLVYNRGASFQLAGDRYSEMRAIRAAMIAGKLTAIPGLFRSMARLWTNKSVRGVALRREHEARLFERGLTARKPALPAPQNGPAETDEDDGATAPFPADPPVALPQPASVAPVAIDLPEPKPATPNVQPVPVVSADPVLLDVQTRLKARRYSPGLVDGFWGSGTRGALSGFMNDRGMTAHVPISLAEFHDIADEVRAELLKAETEQQPDGSIGWYRPVSQARANADPEIVKELAPEVVQAKEGRTLTIWGAIGTAFTGLYKTFSDTISNAWDFVFDHKDDLPTDPSYLQTAWGYITSLPSQIWFFVGAACFVFVAVKLHGVVKKIKEDVKTGARQ